MLEIGNILTVVSLLSAWTGGLMTVYRKNKERQERYHAENAIRLGHIEQDLTALKTKVEFMTDYFNNQLERRKPGG